MSKYSNMSGKELKIECGVHGLSKSGRKDELIKRLEKDDRQNPCYEQVNKPEKNLIQDMRDRPLTKPFV